MSTFYSKRTKEFNNFLANELKYVFHCVAPGQLRLLTKVVLAAYETTMNEYVHNPELLQGS